jgi:hypothetical protein
MAVKVPTPQPSDDANRAPTENVETTSNSAFYRFLEQALTLGARGIRRSASDIHRIPCLCRARCLACLSLAKMLSGANSFELNEIQEEETAITKRC